MAHQIVTTPLAGVVATPDTGRYGVYDHGAHVWAWQPDGGRPVLWLSDASLFEPGKAIRGGIPVCFPWFGPGRSKDLTPTHGFARLVSWHRAEVIDGEDALTVRYVLTQDDTGDQPNFPYRYEASLEVRFAATTLTVALTVRNTGDEEFSYEEALHTYLAVGDARQASIDGLDGTSYVDKVAGTDGNRQDGPVTFTAETDRIYDSAAAVVLHDPVWERELLVEKTGSADTVVWNPWIAKAAAMADFGDDEWPELVCIEAVNCLDHAVVLTPGQLHTMSQRVTVR